jgi:tetratricopeptide (TPR) repeat protein
MPEDKQPVWDTIRRLVDLLFESIDDPALRVTFAVGLILILVGVVSDAKAVLYVGLAVVLVGLVVNFILGQLRRRPPAIPEPASLTPNALHQYASEVQSRAVSLLTQGKGEAARAMTARALRRIDDAIKLHPNVPYYHAMRGYALKDLFQFTKNLLPDAQRRQYLADAEASFNDALRLDPQDASAHNGLGNIRFFAGDLQGAIEKHEKALGLTGGNYSAASHDLKLVRHVLALASEGKLHPGFF